MAIMRWLVILLFVFAAQAQTLQQKLKARIADFQGTVSLYAKNLDTGATVDIRGTRPVRTASTIKLAILAAAFNEHILWEDAQGPRQFVFAGVTSQTAALRCQIFGYAAFTAERYSTATSAITGTGLK